MPNTTAANKGKIQAIIHANIIAPLVSIADFENKKEEAWAISNATPKQIKILVRQGCIKALCDLLTCPDPKILAVCLESLAKYIGGWRL